MRPALILLAGTLVAAGIALYRAAPAADVPAAGSEADAPPLRPPDVLAPEARTFREAHFEALPFEAAARDSVLDALVTWLSDDDLFVSDFGDMRVKRFDTAGRYRGALGLRRGRAPGEIGNLNGLAFDADTVFVLDGAERALSLFLRDGTFLARHAVEVPFGGTRVLARPGGLLILSGVGRGAFVSTDRKGVVASTFGRLVERQESYVFAVANAELLPLDAGAFLYKSEAAPLFYVYDADTTLVRVAAAAGRAPGGGFPPAEAGPGGLRMAPNPPVYTSGLSRLALSADDVLVVNTVVRAVRDDVTGEEVRPPASILDVYTLPEVRYRYSVRLPVVLRHAQVTAGEDGASLRVFGLTREGDALVGYAVTLR